ncbi:MAG TPA: methyltransferase domain-containing protein [Candidatus Limnocylindria bacterium]|nr:methyltransferase domain-containing protein [Candidatus Limnocylindria bacterium]
MNPNRLPGFVRRLLCAGGTRADRLRDPDAVVAALAVRPGMLVADLGPGYGHFTVRLARAVAPNGVVYAADASPSTLDELMASSEARVLRNLRPVRVRRDRLDLPEPVDLLFVSATYHHLPHPAAYFADARRHLRPGGRVVILEARQEGLLGRWLPHGSSPRRLQQEMADAGYRLVRTHDDIVRGHFFGEFVAADELRPGVPS